MVAAGEINDRYRNANPSQGVGYPMGSLQSLYLQAELLALAGYDPYGYRGAHGQSIEMVTDYYACFARRTGFRKIITAENAKACLDAQEYVGRVVNGVDCVVVLWRSGAGPARSVIVTTLIAQIVRFARPKIQIYDARAVEFARGFSDLTSVSSCKAGPDVFADLFSDDRPLRKLSPDAKVVEPTSVGSALHSDDITKSTTSSCQARRRTRSG